MSMQPVSKERTMRITAAVLTTLAISTVVAPALSRADDDKLGYVDLQRALNEVDEGKTAKAQLKREFDTKQKLLDEKQEELKRMKAELDKQSVVMSDDAKREKVGEFERKTMEAQQLFVQLQKELSERERELTRTIFDKMHAIIREIAEADKFSMVFEKTDAGLLYAPPSLDLTNELIRKYNAKYKGGAAVSGGKKKSEAKK
jgi:outer membrane protein